MREVHEVVKLTDEGVRAGEARVRVTRYEYDALGSRSALRTRKATAGGRFSTVAAARYLTTIRIEAGRSMSTTGTRT